MSSRGEVRADGGAGAAALPAAAAAAAVAAAMPDRPRADDPDQVMARRIAGVRIVRVAGYHDQRGSLLPFLDFESPFWSEPVVHGYVFTIRPGRIKGWGMHKRQADRYFVLSGNLRVVLWDGREDSPDKGSFCEFFFTAGSSGLLYIPPGVWHASQNWGRTLGRIVNLPTVRFDTGDPDKYRLDPHGGAIPFDWQLRDG
jgi:dTDP-4-dehydrorhamnose 3,5-epimerase